MRHLWLSVLSINTFLILLSVESIAQEKFKIKGIVVDASNNSPVEFANIGVVGTYLGTASDFDGSFYLEIDKMFADFKVSVSAVGYQSKELTVGELGKDSLQIINLSPAIYGISQVDIKAQSRVLFGIIKSASNLIDENYINKPFLCNVFYSNEKKSEGSITEAIVSLLDKKGYGDRSYSGATENQFYKIKEIRRNFEYQPVNSGLTYLDDLLLFDIVRLRGNILDASTINNFELELEKSSYFQGDSVWVISYKNIKPDFSSTGGDNINRYSGVIYISKESNAVVRNELNVEKDGYFPYGFTAFSNEEINSKNIVKSYFKAITTYRKNKEEKWFLSGILLETKLSDKQGGTSFTYEKMKVLDVSSAQNSSTLNNREYFTNQKSNPDFWARFTLPED